MLDSLMVHHDNQDDSQAKQKSTNMVASLLRIFASEDEVLVPIASEGVAKLLFTGISDDARLCGCLLNQFFGQKDSDECEDSEKGHRDRLQQVSTIVVLDCCKL